MKGRGVYLHGIRRNWNKEEWGRGCGVVSDRARLYAMNLMFPGICSDNVLPVKAGVDSLANDPGGRFNIVMTNPSFGAQHHHRRWRRRGIVTGQMFSIVS
jgi:type I restriction enzyme M protein